MKQFTIILFGAILTLTSGTLKAQTYHLVWEDNFNGTTSTQVNGMLNRKLEFGIQVETTNSNITKRNVTVGNDGAGKNCLIITAKKEDYNGYNFTSGRVNTKVNSLSKGENWKHLLKCPTLLTVYGRLSGHSDTHQPDGPIAVK